LAYVVSAVVCNASAVTTECDNLCHIFQNMRDCYADVIIKFGVFCVELKAKGHIPPPSIGGMGDGITSPNTDSIFWA
jgi:hypothetical protein